MGAEAGGEDEGEVVVDVERVVELAGGGVVLLLLLGGWVVLVLVGRVVEEEEEEELEPSSPESAAHDWPIAEVNLNSSFTAPSTMSNWFLRLSVLPTAVVTE